MCGHCVTFNVSDIIFSQCFPLKNVLGDINVPQRWQNGGHGDNLWENEKNLPVAAKLAKVLIYICTSWVGLQTPAVNNVSDLHGADYS